MADEFQNKINHEKIKMIPYLFTYYFLMNWSIKGLSGFLLEKFNQAFDFSKKIWKQEELFFEADLLLSLIHI